MKKQNKLTNIEQEIMELFWLKKDLNIAEIKYELRDSHPVTRETIKTYVLRLLNKQFIGLNKISQRVHRYFPLISKDEYIAGDMDIFLQRNRRNLSHVVASMVHSNRVSDDEINALEQIINEYKNQKGE